MSCSKRPPALGTQAPTGDGVQAEGVERGRPRSRRACTLGISYADPESPGAAEEEFETELQPRKYVPDNHVPSCPLEALPLECRLGICRMLSQFELYSTFALISRQCVDDSRSELLPQSKRGAIKIRRDSPLSEIVQVLCSDGVRRAFSGDRTLLVLRLHYSANDQSADWTKSSADEDMIKAAGLPNVTSLGIKVISGDDEDKVGIKHIHNLCAYLAQLLPNLEELRLPDWRFANSTSLRAFANCRGIRTVFHVSAFAVHEPDGHIFKKFGNLECLCLCTSSIFTSTYRSLPLDRFGDENDNEHYLFCGCPAKLIHVDLRGVDLYSLMDGPIPQSWLMKFVRRTPTLKSFASDLTDGNIAILQKERPDILLSNDMYDFPMDRVWKDFIPPQC